MSSPFPFIVVVILSLYLATAQTEDCPSNHVKCSDSGDCISVTWICDGEQDCDIGDDELDCPVYQCHLISSDITVESLMNKKNEYIINITKADAEEIVAIAGSVSKFGIDITDSLIKISLLFVNYISALFIIIGLYLYEKKQKFQEINIHYIVIVVILTQHIIHSSLKLFELEPVYCTSGQQPTISWFYIMQNILLCILWIIWVKYSYSGCACCNKYVCGSIFISIFMIPILVAVIILASRIDSEDAFLWGTFRVFTAGVIHYLAHIMIVFIWLCIVNKFTKHWTKCCKISACIGTGSITFIITMLIMLYKIAEEEEDFWLGCFLTSGGYLWMNPIYIVICLYLLFTYARWSIVCQNLIILIIALSGIKHAMLCLSAVNVSYITNALLMQVYIVIMFFSIQELKQWKMDVIQMYTVSIDVLTDILVIYSFTESGDIIFAILQASFIIIGQIIGALSDILVVDEDELNYLTRTDKILTFFGFSGAWFTIKSWSNKRYEPLQLKHTIWEIMFEDIPSVALQMYAALTSTQNSSSTTLTCSIILSIISMSFHLWRYFVDISSSEYKKISLQEDDDNASGIDQEDDHEQKEEVGDNEEVKELQYQIGTVWENKRFYLNLYAFIMSDIYIRTVPLIIFISSIPCTAGKEYCYARIIAGVVLVLSLLCFEFIMNKNMRMTKYQNYKFILSIFSISVLSSFHTILSSLDLLKTDKLYAKCVDFKGFIFEHKIRIYISFILNVITICLFSANEFAENLVKIVLISIYFVALIINYVSINTIQTDIDKDEDKDYHMRLFPFLNRFNIKL